MYLVHDISERRSFTDIRVVFEEILMQQSNFPNRTICPIVLVGNKSDLRGVPGATPNSCVTREEGVAGGEAEEAAGRAVAPRGGRGRGAKKYGRVGKAEELDHVASLGRDSDWD